LDCSISKLCHSTASQPHFIHGFKENALSLTTFRSKRSLLKGLVALFVTSIYAPSSFGGKLLHRPVDRKHWPENLIRAVQDKLNIMGFDAGTADGIVGPNTRRAIRSFQHDKGMEIDGQISSALLKQLGFEQ
jgi:membrane-bound lytic murein transglycosylase B